MVFFNVGFGKYKVLYFLEEEIKVFKWKVYVCVFMNVGFRCMFVLVGDGDVVYCDLFYELFFGIVGFINYVVGGFLWDSQVEFVESCVVVYQWGVKVVISNFIVLCVIEFYEQYGFNLYCVSVCWVIFSKGSICEIVSDVVVILGVQ